MRVVFFGTPAFALPFLHALIEEPDIEVLAVVTQPDKPAGRGNKLTASPCKELAKERTIPVLDPKSLRKGDAADQLRTLGADLFVVVAYGKIIPKEILDIPPKGAVNVHPSLLPAYRGPAPIQAPIKNGDAETGVSIMLLDEGMDTGPVLATERIMLDVDETATTLVRKIHEIGPRLLIITLKRHMDGDVIPVPQDEDKASVTSLLSKEDGRIDWNKPVLEIERLVRAYEPWPGTWSIWPRHDQEMRLRLIAARLSDLSPAMPPGGVTVRDGKLFVDSADGTLEIIRIQPEGKPPMETSAFLAGYPDIDQAILS